MVFSAALNVAAGVFSAILCFGANSYVSEVFYDCPAPCGCEELHDEEIMIQGTCPDFALVFGEEAYPGCCLQPNCRGIACYWQASVLDVINDCDCDLIFTNPFSPDNGTTIPKASTVAIDFGALETVCGTTAIMESELRCANQGVVKTLVWHYLTCVDCPVLR